MEFYATYDVMTGVRIAATLGGFFGLMVFLVIYKSRSHSSHPLKAMKVSIENYNVLIYIDMIILSKKLHIKNENLLWILYIDSLGKDEN